jgi:hypothetical protein
MFCDLERMAGWSGRDGATIFDQDVWQCAGIRR